MRYDSSNPETYFRSGDEKQDMLTLIDSLYSRVELWNTEDQPYNTKLRAAWLKRAKELGATPDW